MLQPLLNALDVFNRAPDKASLENANAWLQDFQHSAEAWSTCNTLLQSPDAPPAAKLFAAQTFRTKVTYDLNQVDSTNLIALRDTLVNTLTNYHAGPRNITVQLCLAIAGLALQLPAWEQPVQSMIDAFGLNPATVPALLQFLTLLPEELNGNTRIPITDAEYRTRAASLLTDNAEKILDLLSVYIQADGVTHAVQAQVFHCLRSWLVAGEVSTSALAATPLLAYTFQALASDDLFDAAVDVICELIHETQEVDDNMAVIELLVPRIISIKPQLIKDSEDAEKIRGYARIFAEAGETYRLLLLRHPETFFPIVEAIGECSAYHDLDIVPITFPFWMRLAQIIGKKPSVSPLFLDAYKALMAVIIRHLHFPPDTEVLSGQELENFRSFRHTMGDTLKDCCFVLGTDTCLMATYQMITAALSQTSQAISWQYIEAPLFAMRSIGAEIDLKDETAVPKIIELIPSLPEHPRIRYAAILIISRYTEWINAHPQYIQNQLQYISAGFESTDNEVSAAAGQALKYMCQDCKQHLVDFLPTLHTFLRTTGAKLVQDDRRQVYEAIAYVICALPMERAAESLKTFSMDVLAKIHALNTNTAIATKAQLQEVYDGLENLEVMLSVVKSFGEELPAACQNSCQEAWSMFDGFITKYGGDFDVAERATRVIRHGIALFGDTALPVAPAVVARMSTAFEATGFPSYMWIAGKIINRFGNEEDRTLRASFSLIYERSTTKVVSFLQADSAGNIPDLLEDYLNLIVNLLEFAPDIFFTSSVFPMAFRTCMLALTVVHTDILFSALDVLRLILTHDSLDASAIPVPPPNFATYASAIRSVVDKEGYELLGYLLNGLVGDFPQDSASTTISIFRAMCAVWAAQVLSWLPSILQQLPATKATNESKTRFLAEVTGAITEQQLDKVKYAVIGLDRDSRKTRDRRRPL